MACAWDPLVWEREKQKKQKDKVFAADLANQWQSFRVKVIPIVLGDLGLVVNLKKHLKEVRVIPVVLGTFLWKEAKKLAKMHGYRIVKSGKSDLQNNKVSSSTVYCKTNGNPTYS